MKDFSYITSSSPAFIENMYLEFVKDPNSVDPDLKKFFEGFDFAVGNGAKRGHCNQWCRRCYTVAVAKRCRSTGALAGEKN